MNRELTPEEREKHRRNLDYRVWQLEGCAFRLAAAQAKPTTDRDWITENALLECFLLRARDLHDFLTNSGKRPDDIVAADLMPGFRRKGIPRETADIDKQIAHFTARCLPHGEPGKKQWRLALIEPLLRDLHEFYQAAGWDYPLASAPNLISSGPPSGSPSASLFSPALLQKVACMTVGPIAEQPAVSVHSPIR